MSDTPDARIFGPVGLRRPIVVIENATKALTPPNRPRAQAFSRILDQIVAEILIVALAMIVRHEFGERTRKWRSLSGIRRSRHSSLIERTSRSAYALQFGARNGVRMTRTRDASSSARTLALHFRSRSQIRYRRSLSTPSVALVSSRTICRMKALAGCGVEPMMRGRRDSNSMTNSV
jgi:hypothetical protein